MYQHTMSRTHYPPTNTHTRSDRGPILLWCWSDYCREPSSVARIHAARSACGQAGCRSEKVTILVEYYLVYCIIRVLDVLEGISSGKEAIDEERMTAIIKRQILNIHNQVRSITYDLWPLTFVSQVEEVPHEFFAFTIIGDFLFGDSPGDFPSYLNQEPRLRQLLNEPPSFWTSLVGRYFIQGPHVIVSGVICMERL